MSTLPAPPCLPTHPPTPLAQLGAIPALLPPVGESTSAALRGQVALLSLLLVFRTNSSYSRWLDARKVWGLVVNRSRDLARQGLTWIPESRAGLRAALCRWDIAFSRALMCHLRADGDLAAELRGVLPLHELDALLHATHRPNYALQVCVGGEGVPCSCVCVCAACGGERQAFLLWPTPSLLAHNNSPAAPPTQVLSEIVRAASGAPGGGGAASGGTPIPPSGLLARDQNITGVGMRADR